MSTLLITEALTRSSKLSDEIKTLKANLARVTSERNEEVQSNVELREKLYDARNDNDRLRDALREAANLLRRIARDERREGKSPMAATKGAEAAEAALKGDS